MGASTPDESSIRLFSCSAANTSIPCASNPSQGRAALSARGGHVSAHYHASTDWAHQRRIAHLGVSARARQALEGRLSDTDALCRRATGLPLSIVAVEYEAGRLDELLARGASIPQPR